MDKSFGKFIMGNIRKNKSMMMQGSDDILMSNVNYWVPTGCWPLDIVIGKGIPGGRLVELYGEESTGKSLLGLHMIAEVQRLGGIGFLLDAEMTASMDVAKKVGIDVENLVVGYPATMEDVFDQIEEFLEAKKKLDKEMDKVIPGVIVWDSIAATSSETELSGVQTGGLGKHEVAPHAKSMSKMLRIIPRQLSEANVTGVFINQTRDKIGVMFGEKSYTAGGKALKFHASVRVKLSIVRPYKAAGSTETVGVEARAEITKNKVNRPFGKCTFPIIFGEGVDNETAVLWYLKDAGKIRTSGPWFYVDNPKGGEELRFQNKTWGDVFKQHEEHFRNVIMEVEIPRMSPDEAKGDLKDEEDEDL